ncbi:hypothetical protein M2G70_07375 [Vibrio vulnificus]|nr:hypothetical protein [Vibrio vulnificus]
MTPSLHLTYLKEALKAQEELNEYTQSLESLGFTPEEIKFCQTRYFPDNLKLIKLFKEASLPKGAVLS